MKVSSTTGSERILTLDFIRGMALLGILFANMAFFKSPVFQLQSLPGELASLPPEPLNQWSVFSIDMFIVGKFYPMFSFLFGLGFYLFYERLREKGLDARKVYSRRLFFLLTLGVIHLIFIWSGDILHTYAITGFLLLLFIQRKPKTILIWSIALLIGSAFLLGGLMIISNLVVAYQEGTSFEQNAQNAVNTALSTYSSGSYLSILSFRVSHEVPLVLSNLILSIPNILGLFLLGLYIGKRDYIRHADNHFSFWKNLLLITLISGGLLSILYACLKNGIFSLAPWLSTGLAEGLNIIAGPLLMLFYISSAVLLFRKPSVEKLLKPIALVGQMALTNYLFQSVICIFIFYGFGLQLYGRIDAANGMLITLIIFAVQTLLSWFWLNNYHQGPMEKVWRKVTYK
ncbi:DUF418 domain-containing protein [Alteribacillus sp. YIM 98480]|uniref:DUF418 domain-containing protein n=1 Tax=Alteribacillus sp. YIM 98480 TaxID=2606599 RepID=UPI00131A9666|nr:DUF418 domain-containing protein [Alteribacillus sp. YIM 98480]